jgi:pimeloyl-ACP methyl ester carboxylesterase
MTEPTTHTLDVPGAVLSYDIHANDTSIEAVLLLIGSPMGAEGFGSQVGHFTDRTVVTYDPRAAGRSQRTDDATVTTPEEHADDLHRLISALGAGPVDIFASSGGAVNGLVLVARHPDQVRTLIAHEPPAGQVLEDRDAVLAACRGIHQTYLDSGFGPAMAKFIALVSHQGLIPDGYADQPGPDPAAFGLPAQDDGNRNDPLLGQNMVACTHCEFDFDAIRTATTRVVLGVGAESAQTMAGRGAIGVAGRIGTEPVTFPGGHNGFMGGEYGGPPGEPGKFAATLREVLAG